MQIQSQDFLKAFIDISKKAQHDRDNKRIEELEAVIKEMEIRYNTLEKEHTQMKDRFESETLQLRRQNIRLDSENKSMKMKNTMLEEIVKQAQNSANSQFNPQDMAAYRILNEQNRQLRQLLKEQLKERK